MSLTVLATPIGNPKDLTLRGIELLKMADVIVGEEAKPTRALLRDSGAGQKPLLLLNEHSDSIQEILEACKTQFVVLVSDCGTPGFCDPGADLVAACRKAGIPVQIAPGPSSLAAFLSGTGLRIDQFFFRGFLPVDKEERTRALREIKSLLESVKVPVILMDTPYRLERLLSELSEGCSEYRVVLGIDLSLESEKFLTAKPKVLLENYRGQKHEFVLMLLPRSL